MLISRPFLWSLLMTRTPDFNEFGLMTQIFSNWHSTGWLGAVFLCPELISHLPLGCLYATLVNWGAWRDKSTTQKKWLAFCNFVLYGVWSLQNYHKLINTDTFNLLGWLVTIFGTSVCALWNLHWFLS
jgi:hypothetical protein